MTQDLKKKNESHHKACLNKKCVKISSIYCTINSLWESFDKNLFRTDKHTRVKQYTPFFFGAGVQIAWTEWSKFHLKELRIHKLLQPSQELRNSVVTLEVKIHIWGKHIFNWTEDNIIYSVIFDILHLFVSAQCN